MVSEQALHCLPLIELFLDTSDNSKTGPEVIELFSCSTQLSIKFALLINLKLLTISDSFLLNIAEQENFSANEY